MAMVMLPMILPGVGTPDTPSDNSMPGLGSFIVFAFMAVALYFLLKNMNARLRRMSYREKEREAAEREARDPGAGAAADGPNVPDLSPSDGARPAAAGAEAGAGGEAGDDEGGAPQTGSAGPADESPGDERGGRAS